MVDVGMGQDDRVNALGIDRELPVALAGFLASPLKEPAVDEEPVLGDLQQQHRPGYLLGRTKKRHLQVHDGSPSGQASQPRKGHRSPAIHPGVAQGLRASAASCSFI